MSRPSTKKVLSLWQIFRIPLLLGALSAIGLVSALVGDGPWDVLSWLMLGIPSGLILWHLWPRRT
jgi:uncharacterized membrane protein YczE